MSAIDHHAEAATILDAHARRVTLAPISDRGQLALDDAYAIQALVTQARLDRGEQVITGGLTRAAPLEPGTTITAHYDTGVSVSVRRSTSRSRSA